MIKIEGLSHYYEVRAGPGRTRADGDRGNVEMALQLDSPKKLTKGRLKTRQCLYK